jgi:hypothetical protein
VHFFGSYYIGVSVYRCIDVSMYRCLLTNCNFSLTIYFILKTIDVFPSPVILRNNRAFRLDKSRTFNGGICYEKLTAHVRHVVPLISEGRDEWTAPNKVSVCQRTITSLRWPPGSKTVQFLCVGIRSRNTEVLKGKCRGGFRAFRTRDDEWHFETTGIPT